MTRTVAKERVADLMRVMHQAINDVVRPVLDQAKGEDAARALRTMLVAVLMNKARELIERAPADAGKGGRRQLLTLAQDILDGKLRGGTT